MHDFLILVFDLLRRGMGLALAAMILGCAALAVAYVIFRRKSKGKKFPWGRAILLVLFAGYLSVVVYATLLRYTGGFISQSSLHLFRAWREAWNNYSTQNWLNVFLNIAMFVPLGVLLPLLGKPFQRWYLMLLTGVGCSLLIETIQYFSGRGIFDVDDLFTNVLGCMIGYCLVMLGISLLTKKKRSAGACLAYSVCPLAFVLVLIGVFGGYHWKEYGNMADAPLFTVDTNGVVWDLQCALSEAEQTVPVYQIETFDKDTCDAFGKEFADRLGISFPDTYYYDNSTIFANHSTGDFLHVEYYDGSYEYTVGNVDWDLEDAEVNEDTLREALLRQYGIAVPENAVFSYEGYGIHTFTVDMQKNGAGVLDGTLRCRCREGAVIKEIDNRLLTYGYYKEETILSQAQAYAKLCSGHFSNGDHFEYLDPEQAAVETCTLSYRIDTKGFYRPVYVFSLTENGAELGDFIVLADQ